MLIVCPKHVQGFRQEILAELVQNVWLTLLAFSLWDSPHHFLAADVALSCPLVIQTFGFPNQFSAILCSIGHGLSSRWSHRNRRLIMSQALLSVSTLRGLPAFAPCPELSDSCFCFFGVCCCLFWFWFWFRVYSCHTREGMSTRNFHGYRSRTWLSVFEILKT